MACSSPRLTQSTQHLVNDHHEQLSGALLAPSGTSRSTTTSCSATAWPKRTSRELAFHRLNIIATQQAGDLAAHFSSNAFFRSTCATCTGQGPLMCQFSATLDHKHSLRSLPVWNEGRLQHLSSDGRSIFCIQKWPIKLRKVVKQLTGRNSFRLLGRWHRWSWPKTLRQLTRADLPSGTRENVFLYMHRAASLQSAVCAAVSR